MIGATFFGLNTLSCMAGTISVLLARRAWNWGRLVRERRRVRRLEARLYSQLSQIVVEEAGVPLAEVLPDTGVPPKGRGRKKMVSPPPKRLWTPRKSSLNRRLSAVWADEDEEMVVRVRPGMRTRSQTSLASSTDSFQSLF